MTDNKTSPENQTWLRRKNAELVPAPQSDDAERVEQARAAVRYAYAVLETWQAVRRHYGNGYSRAAFWNVVHKPKRTPSAGLVDLVISTPAPLPGRRIRPCPSCFEQRGEIVYHDLPDCGGKAGDLVVVAPDEAIRQRKPRRRPAGFVVQAAANLRQLAQGKQGAISRASARRKGK